MEYTIRELADLSGVTTRTLRWYDQIGLLRPARVAETGYRYYGPAEVDRLRDILYYRALGVELARIRECLDDPSFDRLTALRGHLDALRARQSQLDRLIRSVQEAIRCEERSEIMSDQEKFEAFKAQTMARYEGAYGDEARQKYGDESVEQAKTTLLNLTREQYGEWTRLGEEIRRRLEAAVRGGLPPSGEEGREITALHRRWLTLTGTVYDAAKHRGIAQLYAADERFTAYYDGAVPGCARFLRDAIECWAR